MDTSDSKGFEIVIFFFEKTWKQGGKKNKTKNTKKKTGRQSWLAELTQPRWMERLVLEGLALMSSMWYYEYNNDNGDDDDGDDGDDDDDDGGDDDGGSFFLHYMKREK